MDNILIYALKDEIATHFEGRIVNRVAQIDKGKFLIIFPNEKRKFLICASPNLSYFYITDRLIKTKKEKTPFLRLLDRYIRDAVLTKIEQVNLERIIKFYFRKADPLAAESTDIVLIFELIGRQSNLILIDADGVIIDCYRKYTKKDAKRRLAPKEKYILPVPLGKTSLLDMTKYDLESYLSDFQKLTIYEALIQIIGDIPPTITRELLFRAGITFSKLASQIGQTEIERLFNEIFNLKAILIEKIFQPNVLIDDAGLPLKISAIILSQYKELNIKNYFAVNEACLWYYETKEALQRRNELKKQLEKSVKKQKDRLHKKLKIQKNELKSAEKWESYKLFGELINANLHKIKKGMSEIEAVNYYDPKMEKIKIPLNPRLTPQENALRFFKKYKKSKSGKDIILNQIKTTEQSLREISKLYEKIQKADDLESLEKLREELVKEGYLTPQKKAVTKSKEISGFRPRQFILSEGWTVLVGRNNKENDILTLRIAKKYDIWFHAQGATGSHVILKREGKSKEISKKSIMEAASLAAGYSSAKHSSQVPVIYTERRFVRKPKGSPAGSVVCTREKMVFVKPKQKI